MVVPTVVLVLVPVSIRYPTYLGTFLGQALVDRLNSEQCIPQTTGKLPWLLPLKPLRIAAST